MQYYQGLNYTYVIKHRSDLEQLQDLLYSFNAFPNGVRTYLINQVCSLQNPNTKSLFEIAIRNGLIKENRKIYSITERGRDCNFTWYAIRDKVKLGDIKDGDEVISDSVVSSIFHVEPIPLSQEMDRMLNRASSFQNTVKYPFRAKHSSSSLSTYLILIKSLNAGLKTQYEIYKKCWSSSYEQLKEYVDSAALRGYIEKVNGDKKIRRTEFGTALLNVINWYTSQYNIEELLSIGNVSYKAPT